MYNASFSLNEEYLYTGKKSSTSRITIYDIGRSKYFDPGMHSTTIGFSSSQSGLVCFQYEENMVLFDLLNDEIVSIIPFREYTESLGIKEIIMSEDGTEIKIKMSREKKLYHFRRIEGE